MKRYSAYNLIIHSDFELPGFPEIEYSEMSGMDSQEIFIKEGNLTDEDLDRINDSGLHLAGKADDLLRCAVLEGKEIIVSPENNVDTKFLNTVIGGELLGALLRQRGHLVLHAATVSRHGKAITFLGYSGWGKSTTAAYFVRNGYRLLGEDLLVVDVQPEKPEVLPGPLSIKLRPDSGALLYDDFESQPEAYSTTNKRIMSGAAGELTSDRSATLEKMYILEPVNREHNKIAKISKREALIEMVRHTRINSWLNSKQFAASHFNQCNRLLDRVPVSLLQRRLTLDSLPEIRDVVEADYSIKNASI
ncbi:MAG: hypothetical protein GF372_05225 [Candidatus Marinimicrobia bacterium]|nr:hypothetical protein [Candidatus Neomarinimicrobiota bacterium]